MSSHSLLSGAAFPTNSPCAACKFLRRKCQRECIYAPYFKPDQSSKFISVHRIFGASNVGKLLNELEPKHREDAVNSLVYEAEMRIRDPVYGCVGVISLLNHDLRCLQIELSLARAELARYQSVAAAAAQTENLARHQNSYFGFGGYDASGMGGESLIDDGMVNPPAAMYGFLGDQFMRQAMAGAVEKTET